MTTRRPIRRAKTHVADIANELRGELFELELFGDGIERRYRKMRPEIDAMPWGTLDPSKYPQHLVIAARKSWTGAAFQEHRTGIACAATLRALFEARAPLDLIALATRFPLDELVHVEMCARLAMELGGGTEIRHDPDELIADPSEDLSPLMRASQLVVQNFCVGEALSIPMLRGTWHASTHPLTRAVLGCIVKDEAAHGAFGWSYLDWANGMLTDAERTKLAVAATRAIGGVYRTWKDLRERPVTQDSEVHALGWMETGAYLALAERSLESKVLVPLREHGIDIDRALADRAAARREQGLPSET